MLTLTFIMPCFLLQQFRNWKIDTFSLEFFAAGTLKQKKRCFMPKLNLKFWAGKKNLIKLCSFYLWCREKVSIDPIRVRSFNYFNSDNLPFNNQMLLHVWNKIFKRVKRVNSSDVWFKIRCTAALCSGTLPSI